MPALAATFFHCSISVATVFAKSAGFMSTASAPSFWKVSLISADARIFCRSAWTWATIAGGKPGGPHTPHQLSNANPGAPFCASAGSSGAAAKAVGPTGSMLTGLALLAGSCLVLGVFPVIGLKLAESAAHGVVGVDLPAGAIGWLFVSPLGSGGAAYAGFFVFLAILGLALGIRALLGRIWPERRRRAAAWDCGFPDTNPATQYTASSFSQPLRRVFATSVFRARETVDMPPPGDARPARLEVRLVDPAWTWGAEPIRRAIDAAAQRLNALQFLSIRRYLSLMFAALVTLLLVVAASQQ